MPGHIAPWLFQSIEFDITVVTSKGLYGQALSDLLAQFPSSECGPLHEDCFAKKFDLCRLKKGTLPSMACSLIKRRDKDCVICF